MLPVGLVVGGGAESSSLLATVSQFSLGIVATFSAVMAFHAFYPERGPGGSTPGRAWQKMLQMSHDWNLTQELVV